MRTIAECKEFYIDVYRDWLEDNSSNRPNAGFGKELDRINELSATLEFIYQDEFREIEPTWRQEALDRHYSNPYRNI